MMTRWLSRLKEWWWSVRGETSTSSEPRGTSALLQEVLALMPEDHPFRQAWRDLLDWGPVMFAWPEWAAQPFIVTTHHRQAVAIWAGGDPDQPAMVVSLAMLNAAQRSRDALPLENVREAAQFLLALQPTHEQGN